MKNCLKMVVISLSVFAARNSLEAQFMVTDLGPATVIDFDSTILGVSNGPFLGSGFAKVPSSGQLDSDAWAVSGFSTGELGPFIAPPRSTHIIPIPTNEQGFTTGNGNRECGGD